MKVLIKNLLIALITLGFIHSCEVIQADQELYVEADLQPYFDRFIEEGEKRGYEIDLESHEIEGFIQDLSERGIFGQCIHDNLYPEKVIIDSQFWEEQDDLDKEFIVFHELGHCYLDRVHRDETDRKGNCVSIMHSGSRSCREFYSQENRSTYLDELFDFQ